MTIFSYDEEHFLLDGKPVRILSGAIHYFRVVPESWRDRLVKLKNFGCNTVETYVAWNLHEQVPGEFDFTGQLDLPKFIAIAHELGLWVIVRPGPYICAEWEMGGLPAWLLNNPQIKLRCSNQPFLDHARKFLSEVFARIGPLLISKGGPVIMVQVENEYGAFGNDAAYMKELAAFTRSKLDVALFTSDQPSPRMLQAGSTPGALPTANFGSRATSRFADFRSIFSTGPKMCAEFWCGWFDHWGEPHHTRSAASAASALNEILSQGASVNFYMFHGGTNFGFMNGANCGGERRYEPTITSYDYDALLSECGDITDKYLACRRVMERHVSLPKIEITAKSAKLPLTKIGFTESYPLISLANQCCEKRSTATPLTMEQCGQNTGFILYRTTIAGHLSKASLSLIGVRDRAQIFVDGVPAGICYRNDKNTSQKISSNNHSVTIEILVENMGRVNYGPHLADPKGILHGVTLNGQMLFGWENIGLPMTKLGSITWNGPTRSTQPHLFRSQFTIESCADTFLLLPGWNKGVCFVNGHNLGRYWRIGPQQSLYVPAAFLRKGENELIVLELQPEPRLKMEAILSPVPSLGPTGKIREILSAARRLL